MRPRYYILGADDLPTPCDVLTWARWFESADRQIACDVDKGLDAADRVVVSTVFLGLDHNFTNAGDPVLWESMIFGGVLDGETRRYTSRAAARAGHARLVQRVKSTRRTRDDR